MELDDGPGPEDDRPPDPAHDRAVEELSGFFEANKSTVFFGRQLEVLHERSYLHWITNRALHHLVGVGEIQEEWRKLSTGASIHLFWHRSFRYFRRAAASVVKLVEQYAAPNIGAALGLQGEMLVLEGMARLEFILKARHASSFAGKTWVSTGHDLDFIFTRDDRAYGVEVKNTLRYIDRGEFEEKIKLCKYLGLALRVQQELRLPVDSPRALEEGTMQRFLRWHKKHCELSKKSTRHHT